MRDTAMTQAGPTRAKPTLDSARAWAMAGAAFVVGFLVFGVLYSFGVFLGPLAAEFHASPASISLLFSVAGLGFYMLGPVTGHLGDRLGPKALVAAGAAAMGAGLIATAFIGRLWIGYLTYGIAVGAGAACAYIPALAIVGGWFDARRNTALGIAAAGTGCGTMIMPPLTAALIEGYGWRATQGILGVACAILLAICALIVQPPPVRPAEARRPLRAAVLSAGFITMYGSWVLTTMALFVAFVFLPAYAQGQGADAADAAALLSVIGGMSILGRAGIGPISKRLGTAGLFKVSVFVMGASYLLWLTISAYGGLVAFAIVLGLGYGVRIALVPGVMIELFGLANLGAILGIFFTATGVASVLGPMLAGLAIDFGGFHGGGVFALVAGGLGFLAILPLRAPASVVTPDRR